MRLTTEATFRWPDVDKLLELSQTPYGSLIYSLRVQLDADVPFPTMSPAYSVVSKICSLASTADTDHEDESTSLDTQHVALSDESFGPTLFPEETPVKAPSTKKRKWLERLEKLHGSEAIEPKRQVCRFFSVGTCKSGDACPYLHNPATQRRIDEPCRYLWPDRHHQCCSKGTSCAFSHELEKFPCPFLNGLGSCTFSGCRFSHEKKFPGEKEKSRFAWVFRKFPKNSSTGS